MKKQRKLLTTEEKEKICKDRKHICAKSGELCPLFFRIGVAGFCYKDDVDALEEIIEKVHNEEIENMIKFDSEKGMIQINGTITGLVCDALLVVKSVYDSLVEHGGEKVGEHFKELIIQCLPDAFISDKELKEKSEKSHEEAEKMLNSMQEMIDKLREMHDCIGVDDTKKENFQDDFRNWLYSQEGDNNADL